LSVLVRFIIFNCFTLRFFQITFFTNFILFFTNKSKFYFNCKWVQFQFLLFSKQSQFLFLFAVQSPISLKLQFSPRMSRKQFSPHVTSQLDQRPHGRLYKATRVRVRKVDRISATSQTTHKFLSPFSWIKTITNSINWRTILNPNRFRSSIQAESMEFVLALRDSMVNLHHWALSSAIQASDSSLKATNPNAITEARIWEEEGTNSKILNQRRRKRRRITVYFRISSKNQQKQNQIKRFLKIQSNLRIKPGENQKLTSSYSWTTTDPNWCKSITDSKSFGSES